MELNKELKKALTDLRKEKERKFDQTVDLIVNLQKFDSKKENVNLVISIPHKIKDKKVAGFLETKNPNVDTIVPTDFSKYNDKGLLKRLVKKYDFFIAQASLMPKVATTFGKVLGPAGKMPSPQLGIITNADDKIISELKNKVNTSMKIRSKEASLKIPVGKQSMSDEDLIENITSVYNSILKSLSKEKDNVKNIELKFTMTKPIKIPTK